MLTTWHTVLLYMTDSYCQSSNEKKTLNILIEENKLVYKYIHCKSLSTRLLK